MVIFITAAEKMTCSKSAASGLFVKKSIAPYKFPRWIEFVKELPTTETGKVQRYKLKDK
jgi:acyl-coenzyme A synthetase/AMP-(fatty) acid ligase